MPITLNSPPFPNAAAPAATAVAAIDGVAVPADAFALILLAAGGDPALIAGKDAIGTLVKGPLLDARGLPLVADDKGAAARVLPRDPLLPIGAATQTSTIEPANPVLPVEIAVPLLPLERAVPLVPVALAKALSTLEPASREERTDEVHDSSVEAPVDPAALTAAMSATIASALKVDLPPRVTIPAQPEPRALAGAAVADRKPLAAQLATPGSATAALFNTAPGAVGDRQTAVAPRGRETARLDTAPTGESRPSPTLGAAAGADMRSATAISNDLASEIAPGPAPEPGSATGSALAVAVGQMPLASATTAVHRIDTPITAPGWAGEFAGKLTQVVMLRSDRAEFHLHPAELGPVDVQITFAANQAVVLITAPHAATRDALEQTLPFLRDMLADQGISLGQATVQSERNPAEREGTSRGDGGPSARAIPGMQASPVRVVTQKGLVDTFA